MDLTSRKTLADFLFEQSAFTSIILIEFDQGSDEKEYFKKVRKEKILEPFLTKKINKSEAPSGYDSNVHNYPFSKYTFGADLMEAE